MQKRIFLVALALGASVMGFAQTKEAKQKVFDSNKELLECIKAGNPIPPKKSFKFGIEKDSPENQFILEKSGEVKTLLGLKKDDALTLRAVYNKAIQGLKKKEVVEYTFDYQLVSSDDGVAKKETKGKNKGKVSETKFVYTTINQVYAVVKKGDVGSNAKYDVTFKWLAELNTGKNAETRPVEKVTLTSVKATEIPFLASEKNTMQATAKKLVEDWYANLKAEDFPKYRALQVKANAGDISVELPNSKNITVAKAPSIKVNIDPVSHFTTDAMFYENPEAYYTLTPTFTIAINDDLKTGEIKKVDYKEENLQKPETDAEKLAKWNNQKAAASTAAENFANKLSAYTQNPNKESKAGLEGMFINKKSVVEVSNVSKQGKERIDKRTVEQYFSRLKGINMKVVLEEPVFENSLEIVIFPFNQEFNGKVYCDYTDKELHLKYDADKSEYFIEKIVVKPNSTKLCAE
jgi:hypothetical protein